MFRTLTFRLFPRAQHLPAIRAAAFVIVGALIPGTVKSQAPDSRAGLLVSTEWLAANLADRNLVLLHVGDRDEYEKAHIPGARFVSLDDVSVSEHSAGGRMLQMQSSEQLRAKLAGLGISDDSRIVVYYGNDWVTPATRVVFTLDYAGLGARTSLLDGGMQRWKRENRELNDDAAAARRGTLSTLKIRPLIVDADWVKANVGKPGVAVVDGRAAAFYDGVQTGGGGPHGRHKTGHIAGAKSIPFTEITDRELMFKSPAQLAALFRKAGVKPGDTVVGYCHIGQQATGMLFAARTLGHKVLLYDGSFEDWSSKAGYPVETGSAGR